jgi:threonine dehydratase
MHESHPALAHPDVRLSLENIARAARAIDPVFRGTPQFEADTLGELLGERLVVKVETVNPIRSFKGRGTDFFMQCLAERPSRVVCASAGNFGQGMAYASRKHGVLCEVFAAESANPLKVERMRALGARVRLAGADFDAAKAAARDYASREGSTFVEDGRDPAIAEGAGSIGVELSAWPEPFTTLLVPIGNGALLGGIAAWFHSAATATRIIGVVAAAAPAMELSWRAGTIVETGSAETIADGIAVRVPVPEALDDLRDVVDDVLLVEESSLIEAVRAIWETCGLLVEPAGAAGVAALMQHRDRLRGGLIGTVLCGANVTRSQMREWRIGGG